MTMRSSESEDERSPERGGQGNSDPRSEGFSQLLSEDLFRQGRVVLIRHDGEIYRLMITRNNRLILQK